MKVYTIGFAQKTAKEFFTILDKNKIECVLDVRLNNVSQLAGFTKSKDLQFFLKTIINADYIHNINYAPTKEILDNYKKGKIDWKEYETLYKNLITKRQIEKLFLNNSEKYNSICLLCSEATAVNCHRRLLADYLKSNLSEIEVIHL
ncbi:MAG: DUF488 domain-containing protein [Candidatus Gastranaerophilales bacterium]|nr:DUF488 domain-containing protein [Candidatus Gastranaerophilales bacterium]